MNGDVPLDMTEVDWGDAANEVDAFLNETDDDDEDEGDYGSGMGEDDDGNETDGSSFSYGGDGDDTAPSTSNLTTAATRKRGRNLTDSEDESSASSSKPIVHTRKRVVVGSSSSSALASSVGVGSPLQKRVKTARSRTSKLKVSFPPPSEDGTEEELTKDAEEGVEERSGLRKSDGMSSSTPKSLALLTGEREEEAPPTGASSEMDSDDEAFFKSMAAEVEQGWSKE